MKKYDIIYADPPWSYSNKCTRAAADNHYNTMSLDEIKALSLFSGAQSIAADDCALFLWVTAPMLPFAFDVIKAWGFNYKTVAFTWIKRNKKKRRVYFGDSEIGRAAMRNFAYLRLKAILNASQRTFTAL